MILEGNNPNLVMADAQFRLSDGITIIFITLKGVIAPYPILIEVIGGRTTKCDDSHHFCNNF